MTSESQGQTEPWIEKHKAAYAYAYDKGNKLSRELGVTGLPTAVLVDASGVIQWVGHPGSLNDSIVKEHLAGAVGKPLWEWPKDASKVKKAVLKGELGKALAEAEKLDEEHAEILAVVRGMIDSKLKAIQAAKEAGDWMRVDDMGDTLKKSFSGLPELDTVKVILDDLKADKDAQTILSAQRKVAKLFEKEIKRKQIPKLKKELESIVEKHPGTAAERDALEGLKTLEAMRTER